MAHVVDYHTRKSENKYVDFPKAHTWFDTICFIKNSKRYPHWLISLEYALKSYIILWKLLRSETKLRLICEIMNAHTAYLSSQSQSWNFYICVFLTLRRPIWLCWSFYTTCNNIMCFVILWITSWRHISSFI